MIPQAVIEEILNKVSIIDVIGKYTEVRRNGRNSLSLCPFHQEKSPSFSISEEKGLYHCFGCGASGNTIRFLMEYNKLSFMEALQELAKDAGIDLSQYQSQDGFKDSREREAILKINTEAMRFFHKNLGSPDAAAAREYLKKRGITVETIKTYRLGFGGKGWTELSDHLKNQGFSDSELIQSGLSTSGRNGVFDRFRERVIFPIMDRNGHVAGFGGRILTDDKKSAKYLNTSENLLFHKGNLLFSLNFAKDAIIREKCALIVEGYMDVIALFQNGITNSVAPLGTALTESQLQILRRFADKVLFVFDGDGAGIKAANRALDIAVENDMAQAVVILPDGKDPYDYVMEKGSEETSRYFKERELSPIDFKLRYLSRTVGNQNKVKFLLELFPYLARIKSAVVREENIRKTASFLKEDYGVILSEYQNFLRHDKNLGRRISESAREREQMSPVELDFIGFLGVFPKTALEAAKVLDPDMLLNPEIRNCYRIILSHPEKETREIVSLITDQRILQAISRFSMQGNERMALAVEFAYKLRHLYIKRRIAENRRLHEEAQKSDDLDSAKREQLLSEEHELIKQASEIEKKLKELETVD